MKLKDKDIVLKLKRKIDELSNSDIPKIIFVGGIPGSGKSLLIQKVKDEFKNYDFLVIDPDFYRKYYKHAKNVEETVEKTNNIELKILLYSLEKRKNIIHISSLRSYEYINELIQEHVIKNGYDIYLYMLITEEVESILSTYERYIIDKKDPNKFARLNKCEYLKLAIDGFIKAVEYFSNKNYFKNIKLFKRGENMLPPVLVKMVDKKEIYNTTINELNRQRKFTMVNDIKQRIASIYSKLILDSEIEEFNKVKIYLFDLLNEIRGVKDESNNK